MQWSLEQQQFVLCGATYTWSFFTDTHHGTNIPRLAESSDTTMDREGLLYPLLASLTT